MVGHIKMTYGHNDRKNTHIKLMIWCSIFQRLIKIDRGIGKKRVFDRNRTRAEKFIVSLDQRSSLHGHVDV